MSIKVSVIMPSLNVAPYIRQCIESVLKQTLHEIEIICIDAGSTDGTREILAEYAKEDARIHLIDSSIKSYGYQVNLGIEASQGKYVGIVETDDFVAPEMFGYLYQLAEKCDVDVAHADRFFVQEFGKPTANHIFADKRHGKYGQKIGNTSVLSTHLRDTSIWDAIYRREFLYLRHIRCNESRGAAYQDIGFLQQVHTLAQSFVYSDRPLYYYRMDREGSSTNQPGWLRFVRQEWQFLLESSLREQPEWDRHRGAVCARLVQCFLVESVRCINASSQEEWQPDAEWLLEHTRELVKRGCLAEEYLSQEERQQLYLLMHSLDSYVDYVRACSQVKQHHEDVLLQRTKSGAIIFGSGVRGRNAFSFLRQHERNVFGFSDNDEQLWGTMIDGVPVIAPEDIKKHLGKGSVIICNKLHWEEILDQLRQLGFSTEKVHVYHP